MLGNLTFHPDSACRKTCECSSTFAEGPLAVGSISEQNLRHSTIGKHPLHFLIVDDESLMREILEAMLQSINIKTTAAINGHDAIQKISKNHYDLVITDVHMPGMDGFSLLKWINEQKKGLKVIFMSGDQNTNSVVGFFRLGALDFLSKPFTRNDLKETLERHCHAIAKPEISQHSLTLIKQAMHEVKNSLIFTAGLANLLRKKNQSDTPHHELTNTVCEELINSINITTDFCTKVLMLDKNNGVSE